MEGTASIRGRGGTVSWEGLDDARLPDHLDSAPDPLCFQRRACATARHARPHTPLWVGGRCNSVTLNERWNVARLDRRAVPRVEYRRTAPALLELEGYRCAVRDLGCGGLRVEPAPAGRVWEG